VRKAIGLVVHRRIRGTFRTNEASLPTGHDALDQVLREHFLPE
jgi:hypothetical protein